MRTRTGSTVGGRSFLRAAAIALVSGLASGCGGTGGPDGRPAPGAEPASDSASVSVRPPAVPPGGTLEVSIRGFPPSIPIQLGIGPPASEFAVVDSLTSGPRGGGSAEVTVSDYLESGQPYVFVAQTRFGSIRAVSEAFLVVRSGDTITVQGRLTGEGVECPALRTPLGVLYTLAGGDLSGVDTGDEVEIRGTVPDISTCMQGIPLSVIEVVPR